MKPNTQTASASRLTVSVFGTFQNLRVAGATIAKRFSTRLMRDIRLAGTTETLIWVRRPELTSKVNACLHVFEYCQRRLGPAPRTRSRSSFLWGRR